MLNNIPNNWMLDLMSPQIVKPIMLKSPPSQLLLGYPASGSGAGSGYIDPSQLKSMYQTLKSEGYTISGFMTWSIGWDEQNNWNFADTLGDL